MIANTRSTSTLLLTHRVLCCVSFFSLWTKQKKKNVKKKKFQFFFFLFLGFFLSIIPPFVVQLLLPVFELVKKTLMQLTRQSEIWTRLEERWNDVFRLRSARKFFFLRRHTHTHQINESLLMMCVCFYMKCGSTSTMWFSFCALSELLYWPVQRTSAFSYRFGIITSHADRKYNEPFSLYSPFKKFQKHFKKQTKRKYLHSTHIRKAITYMTRYSSANFNWTSRNLGWKRTASVTAYACELD